MQAVKVRIVKQPPYGPVYGFEVGQVLTASKAQWNRWGGYMVEAPGNKMNVHLTEKEAVPIEEGGKP